MKPQNVTFELYTRVLRFDIITYFVVIEHSKTACSAKFESHLSVRFETRSGWLSVRQKVRCHLMAFHNFRFMKYSGRGRGTRLFNRRRLQLIPGGMNVQLFSISPENCKSQIFREFRFSENYLLQNRKKWDLENSGFQGSWRVAEIC